MELLGLFKKHLIIGFSDGIKKKCAVERIGSVYGGWTFNPDSLSQDSIVLSFGIGEDITFDEGIIKKYGLTVYAFDPTPRSINWLNNRVLPSKFHYYGYGLGAQDSVIKFYPPSNKAHVSHTIRFNKKTASLAIDVKLRRLSTIVAELGIQNIDILKMDIEGAEYEVIDDILNSGVNIRQILVEFHHRLHPRDIIRTRQAIDRLDCSGYKLFNIANSGEEYSFIKS